MIVEVNADLDLFRPTLRTAEYTLSLEQLHTAPDIPLRSVFWLHAGSDVDFEGALASDPTVTDYRLLSEADGASLYRARHPAETPAVDAYEAAVETDALLVNGRGTGDGWHLKLWLPDRESLSAFRERCADADVPMTIRSMYDDAPQPVNELYGLTERQRETLLLAAQNGYFTIPRDSTLAELADELDLSSQAASERLRRGMRTLVDNVIDTSHPGTETDLDSDER